MNQQQNKIIAIIPDLMLQIMKLHELNYEKEKIINITNLIYNVCLYFFLKSNWKVDSEKQKSSDPTNPTTNTQQHKCEIPIKTNQEPNNQQPQRTNQEANKTTFYHKKEKCKPYCQNNGSDDICALICSKCKRFGHYAEVCGKDYCGECNAATHRFNKECKNKQ